MKGCTALHRNKSALSKHIVSHFGKYLFCPACGARYYGNVILESHFNSLKGMCRERLAELGFVNEVGMISTKMKLLCNLYYLGLFDLRPMATEHFELLAQRRRIQL